MNIGKARALFVQVASGEYHGSTVGEYLEAVKIVLDMETHNSISKKMIISVCKWLVEIAEKAVSPYRWIPVSERLPEIGGEYLVSVRWYREDDIDIDVYDYDARCKEWNDGESCGQRVIAWMPLPVVYKPNKK